jgi:hypothetical protein
LPAVVREYGTALWQGRREEASLKVVLDPYDALRGAHAAVVVTEWEEVRIMELGRAGLRMEEPKVLVDARNVLGPGEVRAAGIRYRGFGRGYGSGHGGSQEEAGAAGARTWRGA